MPLAVVQAIAIASSPGDPVCRACPRSASGTWCTSTADGCLLDVGGPLVNITASGYKTGMHAVWNVGIGSNVDTAPGAPSPFPARLPVLTGGSVISDTAIDFTGHAVVTQNEVCLFSCCVAVDAIVGDGATIFNQALPVGVPATPSLPVVRSLVIPPTL